MLVTKKPKSKTALKIFFNDLSLNDCFKNVKGRGAIYIKVKDTNDDEWMYELETGKLWTPTVSPVEKVDVEVSVYE